MGEDPDQGDPADPGGHALTGRDEEAGAVRALARLHHIQTEYRDITGRRRRARRDALLGALRAAGALHGAEDPGQALRRRRSELAGSVTEPVLLAWNGGPAGFEVRLPGRPVTGRVRFTLALEDGATLDWADKVEELPISPRAGQDWIPPATRLARLPAGIPLGYHRLEVKLARRPAWAATVISTPHVAWAERDVRTWGVFLPLYALRSRRSLAVGDLTDLETLMTWVGGLGGSVVATLPLLAGFLGETGGQPFEPSPYAPASRLFWNELYVDVERIPELERTPAARAALDDPRFRREAGRLRRARFVDHRATMALKRRVLSELAGTFFAAAGSERRREFERFLGAHPDVRQYARFRAACEERGTAWPGWPRRLQQGRVSARAADTAASRYHLYAQFVADRQFELLGRRARQQGAGLYLDLPLGVNHDGYDVWREQALFVTEASGGAPPDQFFTGGQDWGFPPLHPDRSREQGHRYVRACLRHLFSKAGVVRVDHVMWFHRLFWVPQGMDPDRGVYVRYPSEELYALACLESHRARAMVVGEDLGTVPGYVRRAMVRHGVFGSYVAQYEARPDPARALSPPRRSALAGVNTHDMPTFAAFWGGRDIDMRERLSWLTPDRAGQERRERERVRRAIVRFLGRQGLLSPRRAPNTREVLDAVLGYLSRGEFPVTIANLEDLWLETEPQNVPGTWDERSNWGHKARFGLERIRTLPAVRSSLEAMHRHRSGAERPGTNRSGAGR